MKTFVKNYIGKGKQVTGLQIVKATCKLEDLQKYAYEYDGIQYVTLEVAKMKTKDSFGRDHTVFVSTRVETEEPTIEQEKEPIAQPVGTPVLENEPVPQPVANPVLEEEPAGEIQF